ncbi:MAG: malonyl-ACP O-methyltransferase BioC [Gammaproteobacteria bacterium]
MTAALLDKANIKQAFSAASATYDGVAHLQRAVAVGLLYPVSLENLAGTILDVGCGTGFLTEQLLASAPNLEEIIALDLALPMLQTSRLKLGNQRELSFSKPVNYVCADAERLPLADHSLDGLFSNLALQWCHPVEKVMTEIKRVLKPGSPLVFSTFGPATLGELKSAWAEADSFKHVNDFYSAEQLRFILEQLHFSDIRITGQHKISRYDSVNTLMKELKQIGAHYVSGGRNKKLTTKTQFHRMAAAYEKCRSGGLIPATFDIIQIRTKA